MRHLTFALLFSFSLFSLKPASSQMFCFYNPNMGPIYNNASLGIYDVTAADFNTDGHIDLVTANGTGNNISFIPGYGDGTLGNPDTIAAGGALFCIASADFNTDGKVDVATASSGSVFVYEGNGDGTFKPYVTYSSGTLPSRIYAADANDDGITDLVVACTDGIYLLSGTGNGSFNPFTMYQTGGEVIDVTIADFNNDQKTDLAGTTHISWTQSVLSYLEGNGGGFNPAVSIPVPHQSIFGINSADVDSDGNRDLIVSNHNVSVHRIEVYKGNGDGTFNAPDFYPVFYNPNYVYLTDFNHDQVSDIVVPEGSGYSILTGNPDGTFEAYQYFVNTPDPNCLAICDMDEDGELDLVNPSSGMGYVMLHINCTTTSVTGPEQESIFTVSPNPFSDRCIVSFDVNTYARLLCVSDVTGRIVKSMNIEKGITEAKLDAGEFSPGMYFVGLHGERGLIATERIIISK